MRAKEQGFSLSGYSADSSSPWSSAATMSPPSFWCSREEKAEQVADPPASDARKSVPSDIGKKTSMSGPKGCERRSTVMALPSLSKKLASDPLRIDDKRAAKRKRSADAGANDFGQKEARRQTGCC